MTGTAAFASYWPSLVLLGALASLYYSVAQGLVLQWYGNPEYSHGFLVPLISGYVFWRKRAEYSEVQIAPATILGITTILFALVLLFVGSLGAELFLTRISLLLTLGGIVLYFYGPKMVKALAFPLGFLFLAIPLPALIYNEIVFPLQLLASRIATGSLEMMHLMPILREGNVLILPNCTLEVVEACSGIRSLMSLITLATGYSYLVEKNIWIRWLLILGMVPLAVLANSTRVMVTALLSYYRGQSAAEGLTHELSGLVIFAAATLMMLFLHYLLVRGHKLIHREAAIEA